MTKKERVIAFMKNYTDKELADFMLEMRQHGGRTRWRYLKTNRWRWVLFFGFIALLLGLGLFAHSWGFCGFVVGLVFGIFSRDGVWLRGQTAVWPFYAKVIDWEKVERFLSPDHAERGDAVLSERTREVNSIQLATG
jgi:hypothetical protein